MGLLEYEKGYRLEKEYPLFSIPFYEDSIEKSQDPKLKKITATRLYYLYKKHRKYSDILNHYTKYKNLLFIGKEHDETIKEICEFYKISLSDYYATYPILYNIAPETTGELLELITLKEDQNLFLFIYTYLMQTKKYNELRTILFYLPETIATPILKFGLVVKLNQENTESIAKRLLSKEDLNEKESSDIHYLLGIYYLQNGNYVSSEKALKESLKFGDKKRAHRELAKLYIIQGRFEDACKLWQYPPSLQNESEILISLLCNPSKKYPNELKESIRLLNQTEKNQFYIIAAESL